MSTALEKISKDWQRSPEIGELSARLLEYLSDQNNWQDYFSFGFFKKKLNADDAHLAAALQYLSSPRWHALEQIFIYFDDSGDSHEISPAEMVEYYAAKSFAHPVTGALIHDLDEISVLFQVGAYFKNEGGQS